MHRDASPVRQNCDITNAKWEGRYLPVKDAHEPRVETQPTTQPKGSVVSYYRIC